MRIAGFFVSTALVVSLAHVPAEAAGVPWAADVSMLDCSGTPCIEARLGKSPAGRMLVDTGDVISIIDSSEAAAIGFNPNAKPLRAARPVARIGKLMLSGVPSAAFPVKDDIAKGAIPRSIGSLAYSAFKGRVLQLDFVHKRVRVSGPSADPIKCEASCAHFSLITFGKEGPPIVVAEGFTLNGKPVRMQIDSLYTGNMLIYHASVAKLGLQDKTKTKVTEFFPFTDGGVRMKKARADEIGFAGHTLATDTPLYFPTPGVHQPDGLFDGTVGLALLRSHVVTLDFRSKTIRLSGT